jgi:hypothetical protein
MNSATPSDIEALASEISFRLLATKKHTEYKWLVQRLSAFAQHQPPRKTFWQVIVDKLKRLKP